MAAQSQSGGAGPAYTAGGTISPCRFVKFSADGTVVQAAAATDLIIGVSDYNTADYASGDTVVVIRDGYMKVDAGGTVTRGTDVTSDSAGKAVNASAGNKAGGIAEVSGASGERVTIKVQRGTA